MMDLDALLIHFEPVSWEWSTACGLYLIDRFAPGYEARWQADRGVGAHRTIALRNAQNSDYIEWPTARAAKRACALHFTLCAHMDPERAAQAIARDYTLEHFTSPPAALASMPASLLTGRSR